jgi:iron complex outermembrane receptor protein
MKRLGLSFSRVGSGSWRCLALSAVALSVAPPVMAQAVAPQTAPAQAAAGQTAQTPTTAPATAPADASATPDSLQEVVVTGTHIVRDGYSAPTPLTVVGQEQLQTSATNNIADYLNTIPAFQGSETPQNQYHQSSNGLAGLNTLNLRDLGASRTLVLIDGQRSVGSTTTGLVDINNIPQDLVSRVDVVTGGASAVYGSDAISGVVNFVLDKNFTGTKINASGGVTTYGDDPNGKIGITEGFGFDDNRGHFIVSGEATDDDGIRGVPRAWNNTQQAIITNPAYTPTNGLPQLLRVSGASLYTATQGGIITSGPLANTQFGPGGTPSTFQLGSIVANPYTVGGSALTNPSNLIAGLTPEQTSQRIFTRASFNLTDDIDIFGQYSWARTHTDGQNEPNFYFGNLNIKSDNAYIPASVESRLTALGITSFSYGTLNGDLPEWNNVTDRTTQRYVGGADGKFTLLGSDWKWSGYFERGTTDVLFRTPGVSDKTNYMQAIDAVVNPATGAVVCRSTLTNPSNGCVPYNVFGTGVNSQAAIDYVEPSVPTQNLSLAEDVFSGQLSGTPFSDWAGPVSLAAGVSHRSETVAGTADPNSGNYFAANFAPIFGGYTVTEGSLETVMPLAKDIFLVKNLDLNAAARATDYSTSGYVTTWKAGLTWDVIPDLRFRGTISRDIRAPNLSELFQTGAGGTGQILDDFRGRTGVLYRIVQQGNLNLQPEKAKNTGGGLVLQPRFLPNFSASVDYWRIDISGAIGTIQSQQDFDLCYEGNKAFCNYITPNPSTLTALPASYVIINQPVNLADQIASGIDFETGYRFDLSDLVARTPGSIDMRFLSTHYIENTTNQVVTPPIDEVNSQVPRWEHHLTLTYTFDPVAVTLIGRYISAGVLDPTYVVCSTNCPAATLNNPTVDSASQPSAFYLDSAITYDTKVGKSDLQFFLNIQNLLNRDPPIVPESLTGLVPYFSIQTNPALYDVLGRTFKVGFRLTL